MADLEAQEKINNIHNNKKIIYEVPEFDGKNIPVKEVAKLMGKDQQFIRQGIIRGILPIGIAFKKTIIDQKWNTEKESSQYDFYISPRLLWEYTGIIYKSKVTVQTLLKKHDEILGVLLSFFPVELWIKSSLFKNARRIVENF